MIGPIPTQCQRCSGSRLARILAHCSDMCSVDLAGRHFHGYVPRDLGIGGGDDVQFDYCLDCGQIQGKFPLRTTELETPPGAG
jgi:hypothetical protein